MKAKISVLAITFVGMLLLIILPAHKIESFEDFQSEKHENDMIEYNFDPFAITDVNYVQSGEKWHYEIWYDATDQIDFSDYEDNEIRIDVPESLETVFYDQIVRYVSGEIDVLDIDVEFSFYKEGTNYFLKEY